MANINKNELYNLICEYYEKILTDDNSCQREIKGLTDGMTYSEWSDTLCDVKFVPPSMTALVREGKMAIYERGWTRNNNTKSYYKPLTDREKQMIELKNANDYLATLETRKQSIENRYHSELARIEREYKQAMEELAGREQECIVVVGNDNED